MFLSCGDALFDLFSKPDASTGAISLAGHVGGSPLNVAVGLARLGNPVAYLCRNSSDLFGQRIHAYLELNRVSTHLVTRTSQNSTLAVVEKAPDGSAIYAFYTDNTADVSLSPEDLPDLLEDAIDVIHVGSYATAVKPVSDSLLQLVRQHGGSRFISYDPNIRLAIEPDTAHWREVFAALAVHATLIKASDEDIAALFGDDCSHSDFAARALSAGTRLVLITRGAEGAAAYSADGSEADIPGPAIRVEDTVGAGDTFQAAALHWLNHQGHIENRCESVDLPALLRFCMTAAAITCTRQGADLPTLPEVETALANS